MAGGSAVSVNDTNQNPPKKLKSEEMAEDRLSALPDVLILHILSFLDTKETVKTCCLSKRWELIWTGMSTINLKLDFRTSVLDREKVPTYVEYVSKMLAMCRGLGRFDFTINCNKYASSVDSWVYSLVRNEVKDICLESHATVEYKMPEVLFSHSSMENLHVNHCAMTPRGVVEWRSLKCLSFSCMVLSDSVMEKILSGCPVLETLSLKSCWGLTSLNISSPNLTKLVIEGNSSIDEEVQISAPYVRDLTIDVNVHGGTKLWFNNLSSVVRAKLGLSCHMMDLKITNQDAVLYIAKLFESLRSVKELELGGMCIEVLSMLEMEGYDISPDSTRLCLKLRPFNHEGSIPGILCMLKSSPYLETLVIQGIDILGNVKMLRYLRITLDPALGYLMYSNLDLILNHLKTIKINNFTGKTLLILVERLLKSSKVLEKMVIKDSIASRLLAFSRASPATVIIL